VLDVNTAHDCINLGKALRFARMALQGIEQVEVEGINGAQLALQGAVVRLEALHEASPDGTGAA